jgi:hypothetical protein
LDHPNVGVLSAWTVEVGRGDRVHIQPCPTVPHIWHDEKLSPYVALRATAFFEGVASCNQGSSARTLRGLFDRLANAGWTGVTYPAVFGSIALSSSVPAAQPSVFRYSSMARAVQRLHTPILRWFLDCPPEERRAFVNQIVRRPRQSAVWLVGRLRAGLR